MAFQRAVEGPDEIARWRRVRTAYEAGELAVTEIEATYGVSHSALQWRARRDLWKRRNRTQTGADRPTIIKRLFRVLEMQVMHLEAEMDDMNESKTRSGEREIELLGKLAANVDKLIKLEAATARPEKDDGYTDQEVAEMRIRLAKRLDQLKRG
jgi:hypothetical protein